jgi:integrase
VDFERRQILVRQSLVKDRLEYTKNDGSFRTIEMSQLVFDALSEQKKVTGNKQFVFCTSTGGPLNHNNLTKRVWYPLLRHLGLRKRRPYQTRHTAATLWLAAGENPEWIARQMGHTTTEMLFRVYSRYVPNLTRRDGSAFERLLINEFNAKTDPKKEGDS